MEGALDGALDVPVHAMSSIAGLLVMFNANLGLTAAAWWADFTQS